MNRHEFMQKKVDPPKVKRKAKKKSTPQKMTLTLRRGSRICLTGAGSVARSEYVDGLEYLNIRVVTNASRADVLVYSRTDTVKYDNAISRGIPVMDYFQLDEILGISAF